MKNYILVLSIIIVTGLSIGTYLYEIQEPITSPQPTLPNETQEYEQSQNEEEQQVAPLQPVNNDRISYTLQHDELNITYNYGDKWVRVPVEKDLLFNGEYQGNKQRLIDSSYILTEDRAAFLYKKDEKIVLKYSHDQGDTWQDRVVSETFPPLRFRKVDFLNEQFGYVIVSGGRTMSEEYSTAFLTHDGGETWEQVADPPTMRMIANGGFVDEMTGFLSYGTINPEEPDFYVTLDGGNTWNKSVFHMPEKYDLIFVQAEVPMKEGDHLAVLVNQGPNGDYEGGKVKGKFVSEDEGLTWDFSMEVFPNETE